MPSAPESPALRILSNAIVCACGCLKLSLFLRQSVRPIISSTVLIPSSAMISRSCMATKVMKFITCSGFPANLPLNFSFCVAIPTGHVSFEHTRIIMQPRLTSGAVANPYSSAPSRAAMATSLPVMSLPSVSILTLDLRPLSIRALCVSATPSSHGSPALWTELNGAAPVPPSYPEIRTTWAPALATPEAIVPTPASETSFTEIRADLLAFFKS